MFRIFVLFDCLFNCIAAGQQVGWTYAITVITNNMSHACDYCISLSASKTNLNIYRRFDIRKSYPKVGNTVVNKAGSQASTDLSGLKNFFPSRHFYARFLTAFWPNHEIPCLAGHLILILYWYDKSSFYRYGHV